MYYQPNVGAFLYIIASTFYFTNSKKSGAVGNGNGDLSVTFCHTCCREAGTNDDSLIFSIPQAGAMSSRFAKVSGYIRSPSENPPDHEKCLYVSHVFSKKIWYLVLSGGLSGGLSKPRKIAANCQGQGCPIASSPLTQNCRQDDPNSAQHWDTNPIGTPKH
jgi:hypothetical protein